MLYDDESLHPLTNYFLKKHVKRASTMKIVGEYHKFINRGYNNAFRKYKYIALMIKQS